MRSMKAFSWGLITDGEGWMNMFKDRNQKVSKDYLHVCIVSKRIFFSPCSHVDLPQNQYE